MGHPFDTRFVDTVVDRLRMSSVTEDARDSQRDAQAVGRIESQLDAVQSTLENHLMTLIANIHTPQTGEQVMILDETHDRYYLDDDDEVLWTFLTEQIETLDETVRYIHQRASQSETDTPANGSDQYVIAKPQRWKEAEWLIESYLIALADRGLSAAQTLDYFMARKRGIRTGRWADSRQTTAEGIRQNVKNAEKTLDETMDGQDGTDIASYFERTYRGTSDGQKRKVTADHGRLEPRMDIETVARSGTFDWGTTGNRTDQLSVALLADALGKEGVDAHRDEFSSVVAGFESDWELKASEIEDWAALPNHLLSNFGTDG